MRIKTPISAPVVSVCVFLAILAPGAALANDGSSVSSLGHPDLKIPPGHLPPRDQCKIWYPNRAPGQQPPPARCDYLMATAPPNVVVIDHDGRIVLDRRGVPQDPPNSGLPSSPPAPPGGTRFVDNGDDTVTDKKTGLMWEKKLAEDGTDGGNCIDVAQYKRDVHCVNNLYTWTDPADGDNTNPDGTAFTDFLSALNQEATNDRNSTCYASHCDWRLPRLTELRGILAEEYPCSTNPCVDSTFDVTDTCFNWSYTSGASSPSAAWGVDLSDGNVTGAYKDTPHCVRAVRNTVQ